MGVVASGQSWLLFSAAPFLRGATKEVCLHASSLDLHRPYSSESPGRVGALALVKLQFDSFSCSNLSLLVFFFDSSHSTTEFR
jgi:hypothetical protein